MTDAVLREVWYGRVWRAHACRIVEERPELTVLWSPRNAPGKLPVDAAGREVRIPVPAGWTLADRAGRRDTVALFRPGAHHSVWLFRQDDGSHAYWYVNFEQPLRRTPIGFDFCDEKLDLVVDVGGTWRFKDEDELEHAARMGLVDADAVRAEAERVLAQPPWPTGWEDWRPDPSWPIPALPQGWDLL